MSRKQREDSEACAEPAMQPVHRAAHTKRVIAVPSAWQCAIDPNATTLLNKCSRPELRR